MTRLLFSILLFVSLLFAQGRDPLPVPDLPGYRTLKCDFHMHTVFSDGDVWPTLRINEAWRDGLDAIALTDHADYRPHKADVKPDGTRPHAIAGSLAEQVGIILVPAIELSEGNTHCNALFVTDPNALAGLKLAESVKIANSQGAFVFWNHPGWRREKAEWLPLIATLHEQKLIQGMELLNGTTFYPEAYPWVEEKGLAIFANSDTHGVISAQYGARGRPVTLVFARTADLAGVREALFARRTAAWMNGQVWGAEEHLKGLWQGAVALLTPELRREPGKPVPALRIHNRSAIPFQLKVRSAPEWLRVSGGELRPESISGAAVAIGKTAPAGVHSLELELEIANLHTGPKTNLIARLPLRVDVRAAESPKP